MTIGEKIRELRRAKGLSQAKIAEKFGMKREYFCKIETGALQDPTILTLKNIKNAMGINWRTMFQDVDE